MPTKKIKNLLAKFIELEYAGGLIMILSAALAMFLANSGVADYYKNFRDSSLSLQVGMDFYEISTVHFVKDVLMVFFFLIIGLELKYEMTEGFLKKKSQILLPLAAALGGMLVPALIYLLINANNPENFVGWAIPAATDIAFAICVLTIFGRRIIPPAVRIFLLAIAIFDDIGAIIIIAVFFGESINLASLLAAAVLAFLMFRLDRVINPNFWHYIILGSVLAYLLHIAGIHSTIAGVITGLAVPLRDKTDNEPLLKKSIKKLHPFTTYFILPLFAFVSAGVPLAGLEPKALFEPIPLGIILGLFVGKQIGIFGVTYALIKLKISHMPQGAKWGHIYAVSILAGIGFTMSLFIGLLAFPKPEVAEMVKLGVICASLLSAFYAVVVMKMLKK